MAVKIPNIKVLKHLAAGAGMVIILLMFVVLAAEIIKNIVALI